MFLLFRWLFRLAVLIVILGLIAVGLDYGARIFTQDQIASAVKRSTGARSVSVSISSFPYLYHLADQGRVDKITVVANSVPAGDVDLTEVSLTADTVKIDRNDLLKGKEQLQSVSRATVTVEYQLTGAVASLARGLDVTATATSSRSIEFTAGGRVIYTINLASIPLIPECDLQGSQASGLYTFTCTAAPVPAAVLNSLSR